MCCYHGNNDITNQGGITAFCFMVSKEKMSCIQLIPNIRMQQRQLKDVFDQSNVTRLHHLKWTAVAGLTGVRMCICRGDA